MRIDGFDPGGEERLFGDYYFSNRRLHQALPYYERCLQLDPGHLHALVRVAQIHDGTGTPPGRSARGRGCFQASPDHAEGRARAQALRRQLGR